MTPGTTTPGAVTHAPADDAVTETQQPAPAPVEVKEGLARVLIPEGNKVFYNKAQVNNRDLSVAALRCFARTREEEWHAGTSSAAKRASRFAAGDAKNRALEETPDLEEEAALSIGKERMDAVLAAPPPPMSVIEAMAASGLRSIRYAKEVRDVGSIVATELVPTAAESIAENATLSGVSLRPPREDGQPRGALDDPETMTQESKREAFIDVRTADCRLAMLAHNAAFDVVDLDPYGSPAPFLDSAVQAVSDNGLLCVTATDMAVLCGNNAEVCWSKYGSYPIHRRSICHEMAIRILLHSIASHAARYKRVIEPLLCVSMDFYLRCFIRVRTSAADVKLNANSLSYVYYSSSCDAFHMSPVGRILNRTSAGGGGDANDEDANDAIAEGGAAGSRGGPGRGANKYASGLAGPHVCEETGSRTLVGGPIWNGPIHNMKFVRSVLDELKRDRRNFAAFEKLHGLLTVVQEELPDAPLHVDMHAMATFLKCTPPSQTTFKSALVNAGYRVSGTHSNPLAVKTDAPTSVTWDIMRAWVAEHPIQKPHPENSPAYRMLEKEQKTEVSFFRRSEAMSDAKKKNVTRFVQNPAHWGPQRAASTRAKRTNDDAPSTERDPKAARVAASAE